MDHWQLLSSIIHRNDTEGSRRVKAWLTPILNRTPLAPIFIAFLGQVPHVPPEIRPAVFTSFAPCFTVLWPLAKHKINIETLLECFSATLKIACLDTTQKPIQFHATVCPVVATTYLSALARTPNRKKVGPRCPLRDSSITKSHSAFFRLSVEPLGALAPLRSHSEWLWIWRSLPRWGRNLVCPGNTSPVNR